MYAMLMHTPLQNPILGIAMVAGFSSWLASPVALFIGGVGVYLLLKQFISTNEN